MLKLKNKNGFTLVELVVVVIILSVILAFALPNITSTLERNNKDKLIADAKDFVEKTKNYMLKNNGYPLAGCIEHQLDTVDIRKEIKDSPYGKPYERTDSIVKTCLTDDKYTYEIKLIDSNNNGIRELKAFTLLDTEGKYGLVQTN